ncbi:hypothetical protein BCR44DRAFT_1175039 [Catenaria anguillulae PL171]|uniref:RPEL repeat protein n=1 Tax=Catenaria anguillulae PL171 TaxID=765915 RepID=A0A1Y2I0U1_9FUNG|nr:hypothetical protein BCR44DRAFT_1175039 [Catenaria anguillulae PL171]
MLSSRPTKEELISRNILKDDKVSPRLQAAQEELKKKQLEDMLNKKIPHRANVEELVHSNILHADPGVAPALQAAQDSLKRAQIEDEITKNLRERPSIQQLQEKEIIKPAEEKAGV